MSIDVIPKFDQMRNAALIQILEKAWPGCEAQNKHTLVVFKHIASPEVRQKVGAFIEGWNAGLDWAREQMLSAHPFKEPGLRGSRVADLPPRHAPSPGPAPRFAGGSGSANRDSRRSAEARAALESIFEGGRDDAA